MIIVLTKLVLLGKINIKKREMYSKAKQHDLTNPHVVNCSQELDILLNKYQEIQRIQDKCYNLYRSSY
ncbi:aspartyl-phosphate phosphatase Spo0E family protein [Paenisporosarcina antarctica]|uniref:Aspartyl-phosphate phosphatase Spo0E family protein n=1 Tax=Paenisporosarcina antarctica TaxID=417367 RepID=A0A4P7A283_9BACL|nr:aspartyl-phosphate phosphatase Spo0E family protein [Paenisporosarcina antarctica]QBP42744.1 aspartyl-phosphate phosphatase Spo0E family protein [Paenisporosarcina antarctica]